MTRDLTPLLAPRSIAIVGASEATDSWAPEIERSLRHVGFRGDLFPVNPKYDAVWGRPCVASVADLPLGVDLAVVVVPARVAVRMVDACGDAGVQIGIVSALSGEKRGAIRGGQRPRRGEDRLFFRAGDTHRDKPCPGCR